MKKSKNFKNIEKEFKKIQNKFIKTFLNFDKKSKNVITNWKHHSGGGGVSCEIYGGNIFERAAINFSSIEGSVLPNSALSKRIKSNISKFLATGVSVVIHPANPFVPCSHLNVRFFDTNSKLKKKWWFGGGYDLTPYFINENDINLWHKNTKKMCDKHDKKYYKDFKLKCDNYFSIKHRNEKRGVGGIFFDNLNLKEISHYLPFINDVGETYLSSYMNIVQKRSKKKFNENHKNFQLYRRGRYVEFNLVYDRGTLFGLQSGGRADSILMSLPPMVSWASLQSKTLLKYEKDLLKYLKIK